MKTDMSRLHDASLLYARLVRALGLAGIRIDLLEDFSAFVERYETLSRRPAYPVFDPAQSDISAENGFWVLVTAQDGPEDRPIGVHAMRRWRMDKGLDYHLRRHMRLYCLATDAAIDPAKTRIRDDGLAAMTGQGWYHGGLWLDPAYRDHEVAGMPLGRRLLPRLAWLAAVMAGPPDFIWGMAPDPAAERGILASYGFQHMRMDALAFHDAAGVLMWHETILWSSLDDIIGEFRRTAERLDIADRQPDQSLKTRPVVRLH